MSATTCWYGCSPAAHAVFDAIEIDDPADPAQGGTFSPSSPVPDWLRAATAGLLWSPDGPGLCLARVCDPINWFGLVDEHPGDVTLNFEEYGNKAAAGLRITEAKARAAWNILAGADNPPILDGFLQVGEHDGRLVLEVCGISPGQQVPLTGDVWLGVVDALGMNPTQVPCSHLRRDADRRHGYPILPRTAIVKWFHTARTEWDWASL